MQADSFAKELEIALFQMLNPQHHVHISSIVKLLTYTTNNTSDKSKELIVDDYPLVGALKTLTGKRLSFPHTIVEFKENAQYGDISVKDVAGRDIVNIYFNVQPALEMTNRVEERSVTSFDTVAAMYFRGLRERYITSYPTAEILQDVDIGALMVDLLGQDRTNITTSQRVFRAYSVVPSITWSTILAYEHRLREYVIKNRLEAQELYCHLHLIAPIITEEVIEFVKERKLRGAYSYKEKPLWEREKIYNNIYFKSQLMLGEFLNNTFKTAYSKRIRHLESSISFYGISNRDVFLWEEWDSNTRYILAGYR